MTLKKAYRKARAALSRSLGRQFTLWIEEVGLQEGDATAPANDAAIGCAGPWANAREKAHLDFEARDGPFAASVADDSLRHGGIEPGRNKAALANGRVSVAVLAPDCERRRRFFHGRVPARDMEAAHGVEQGRA